MSISKSHGSAITPACVESYQRSLEPASRIDDHNPTNQVFRLSQAKNNDNSFSLKTESPNFKLDYCYTRMMGGKLFSHRLGRRNFVTRVRVEINCLENDLTILIRFNTFVLTAMRSMSQNNNLSI